MTVCATEDYPCGECGTNRAKLGDVYCQVCLDEMGRPVTKVEKSVGEAAVLAAHYLSLRRILDAAYDQAATGKGAERHANSNAFEQQHICRFGLDAGSTAFNVGQAVKKSEESLRLEPAHAKKELLGAINYLAGAVRILEILYPGT